jgi:glycosyltransferase involved in cell wall biosynthesis
MSASQPRPLVSVVIPTYNQPAFLHEALRSVFAQTLRDYEVVVVNDGSTDDTAAQLEQYAGRIRVFTQENQGIGCARNRGMDEARGRYIAFLDHDDLWHPQKLEIQVAFMRAHPDCVGNTAPFAYSSRPGQVAFDLGICDSEGLVPDALQVFAGGEIFMLTSALMIDRDKVGDLRYETRRNCIEDLPLQIRLLTRGRFGVAGTEILVIYRMHQANATKSAWHYANGARLLRELCGRGRFEPVSDHDRRSIEEFVAFFARTGIVFLLMAGLRLASAKSYLSEFRHQLRARRFKFLLFFPPLLLLPSSILKLKWSART